MGQQPGQEPFEEKEKNPGVASILVHLEGIFGISLGRTALQGDTFAIVVAFFRTAARLSTFLEATRRGSNVVTTCAHVRGLPGV